MDHAAPIRSRAADEGNIQIPLWSVPLALVVLYICLFSGLGALGLVGPDEPRYAAIARAMAETHDWVTPRLWGTPWFEKPVLYYWTAGAAMRVFGVSEFAARLPSALAALLAVLAIAWTALRSYGIGAAWYALLMLPTSVAMIGFARAASPDMLFAGLLTAAMAVASEMLQKPRPGPILRIAFGFFLGAAVLAKGPAAVILAGGATLLWAALSRQWRAPFRFLHPLTIVVFCATALPWYILCAVRNPDFLRVFIWQHNFQRYLTPVFEHRQPFWFFGPVLLLAMLPWLPLFFTTIAGYVRNVREKPWIDSPGFFFSCWACFPILFFSLSQSKLPGYVLPAMPALFLLGGGSVARLEGNKRRYATIVTLITGLVCLALAALPARIALDLKRTYGTGSFRIVIGGLIVTAVIALTGVGLAYFEKLKLAIAMMAFSITALVEIANLGILPHLDAQASARSAALTLIQQTSMSEDVAVYQLPRGFQYGLNFYFNRELPEWTEETPRGQWLFTNSVGRDKLTNRGGHLKLIDNDGAPFIILLQVLPNESAPAVR